MAYHSQQVLLMRHVQEKHLDSVLKRKGSPQDVFNNPIIRKHLKNTTAKNVIFILVATPVEEVGRDHDFDWAIIEPSSYRSFIQLAGRVFRHRNNGNKPIRNPNIAIMQYNLRHIKNNNITKKPAFCWPGYESSQFMLNTHNINDLVDVGQITQRIDAQPRIKKLEELHYRDSLIDLEHYRIHKLLTNYEQNGPESMQGWISGCWWLTGMPQRYIQFRKSSPESIRYLLPDDNFENEWWFYEKDDNGNSVKNKDNINEGENNYDDLSDNETSRLWLNRDRKEYKKLLQELTNDESLKKVALIYGEINLPTYGDDDKKFSYSHQLGLSRK
jgi:CRISPR-associated endonuclease/helicase Cas3